MIMHIFGTNKKEKRGLYNRGRENYSQSAYYIYIY